MTQAILPLNVNALRVNANDAQSLATRFKGRTALFERMPYWASSKIPSTGTAIVQPLASEQTPADTLKAGVHLHWELPDVYKRGAQGRDGGNLVFPHAPNTWLVMRYLQVFDQKGGYRDLPSKGFIVESDYISAQLPVSEAGRLRPTVTVPLPDDPGAGEQPYRYMGRVLDFETWKGPGDPSQYLTAYPPHYLTSIGFVGPAFASYYPECCSVFGFWDNFSDDPEVGKAVEANAPIRFRTSYQVIGWVRDAGNDVFAGFPKKVVAAYNRYVDTANRHKAEITITPRDEVARIAEQDMKLRFNTAEIAYTLNPDKTIKTLDAPAQGLCAGVAQEIVWDTTPSSGVTYFLTNPAGAQPNPVWTDDQLRLAVGNTTAEGLSALVKKRTAGLHATEDQRTGMELLLDAFQLGLLNDLQASATSLIDMDEALHTRAFAKVAGGYLWSVDKREVPGQIPTEAPRPNAQITLPIELAETLNVLNVAQKAYDQGRARLDTIRKQLFMDWQRWIADYIDPGAGSLNIPRDVLTQFLDSQGSDCALGYVVAESRAVGVQSFLPDPETGRIAKLKAPADKDSRAGAVYAAWQAVRRGLQGHEDWDLIAAPAPNFWLPTDPVLVMEGDRLEPARRNGSAGLTPVRLPSAILSELVMTYGGNSFTLPVSRVPVRPDFPAVMPMQDQVSACANESFLLIPMLAGHVAKGVAGLPGDNPAKADPAAFVRALNAAQGGASPLDPDPVDGGLYAQLHATGAVPIENPTVAVDTPLAIEFTFTNPDRKGWSPNGTALTAQSRLQRFDPGRYDPFLPVFLLWNARLDPLVRGADENYRPTTLTAHFTLDADAVDYTYPVNGKPVDFTTGVPVSYSGAVVLSRQSAKGLTAQIDRYQHSYPAFLADEGLGRTKAAYEEAPIVSQGIGGFNGLQILRDVIAQVPVEDLIRGRRDVVTTDIAAAATAIADDNWYKYAFNSPQPVAHGLMADNNFGPMRAGFAQIFDLEIVDAFGQRMALATKDQRPNGAQNAIPSFALSPASGDSAHAEDIYLPPRLLAPSRLWFRWLSAEHDAKVKGFDRDFVEMNAHPATSPVCGYVVPNHLEGSLFFYGTDGKPIGSFGVEHGDLVYRSRPGRRDDLAGDIGPWGGTPLVNPHLYDFMWRIQRGKAEFLIAMMAAVLGSEGYLNPALYASDVSLSVLIGQPLVIARAVVGLESQGGVVPVSQADTSAEAPFSVDVTEGRYRYPDRQAASSAGVESISVPVRLGDLAHIDDGMIGYFIERAGDDGPYDRFYAPAAKADAGGVAPPKPDTLQLRLNQVPTSVTLLMDARAPIHATTGILPVALLAIPPDQYTQAMSRLEVVFFTHPVLRGADGLTVPLPLEAGYDWAWIQPGEPAEVPLSANAATEIAQFGFTPQTLLKGYAALKPAPKPPEKPAPSERQIDE